MVDTTEVSLEISFSQATGRSHLKVLAFMVQHQLGILQRCSLHRGSVTLGGCLYTAENRSDRPTNSNHVDTVSHWIHIFEAE
jgi:hypothetical protein